MSPGIWDVSSQYGCREGYFEGRETHITVYTLTPFNRCPGAKHGLHSSEIEVLAQSIISANQWRLARGCMISEGTYGSRFPSMGIGQRSGSEVLVTPQLFELHGNYEVLFNYE